MLRERFSEMPELHEMVINTLSEGIYMVDRDRNILVWNEAAEKITGYSQKEMLSRNCSANFLEHIDYFGVPVCNHCCPIDETMEDGQKRTRELFLKHKRGYRVPIVLNTVPVHIKGEVVGTVASFTNVGIRAKEENLVNSLSKLSTTDSLTGLPNKRQTESILESMMEELIHSVGSLAVLYINLDDFASCNDRYGFDTGNRILMSLADSFRDSVGDYDIVGRWDGEEFVGVFAAGSPKKLKPLSENIRAVIEATRIEREGEYVGVTASIGATVATATDTPDAVVDRAASLMHVSKISGKNCVTIG